MERERERAFIIFGGSKRLMNGSKAHVYIVKRRVLEVVEDTKQLLLLSTTIPVPSIEP